MDYKTFEKYYTGEVNCWWFVGRRNLLQLFLSMYFRGGKILVAGCGTGLTLMNLSKRYDVTGLDRSRDALDFTRKRCETSLMNADVQKLCIKDRSFDAVIALDVIEHVEGDVECLREFNRILTGKGIVILSVPAFMMLWGTHDDVNDHKRRYSKKELISKLKKAGFEIERITFWNFSFFLPTLIHRTITRKTGEMKKPGNLKVDEYTSPPRIVNYVLTKLMLLENFFIKIKIPLPIPFGVSLFCIARKSRGDLPEPES